MYKSNTGRLTANDDHRLITAGLKGLVQKLRGSLASSRSSMSGPTNDVSAKKNGGDLTLEVLLAKAALLAEELSARLDKLRLQGTRV